MNLPTHLLAPDDLAALHHARARIEHPSLSVKLAAMVGAPMERLIERLPRPAAAMVHSATRLALDKCLKLALKSIRHEPLPSVSPDLARLAPVDSAATIAARRQSLWRGRLHKAAVATTGAVGGAFGFISLPVELPVTTTLMFRAIGEIAQANGEDLRDPQTQMQCLMVLAMGGPAPEDDDATYGYFVVRGALAQTVASASAELAGKGAASHGSAFVTKMVHSVAARFSAQVSEQAAAKALPVVGAVFGAAINTVFIHHFQEMAHGHFTIRRLERQYGEAAVRQAYEHDAG